MTYLYKIKSNVANNNLNNGSTPVPIPIPASAVTPYTGTTPVVMSQPRLEMTQQLQFSWKLNLFLKKCELQQQQQQQLQQQQQQQGCVLPTNTGLLVVVLWLAEENNARCTIKFVLSELVKNP